MAPLVVVIFQGPKLKVSDFFILDCVIELFYLITSKIFTRPSQDPPQQISTNLSTNLSTRLSLYNTSNSKFNTSNTIQHDSSNTKAINLEPAQSGNPCARLRTRIHTLSLTAMASACASQLRTWRTT